MDEVVEKDIDKDKLALKITQTLKQQGFTISKGTLIFDASTKQKIRKLHSTAINHILEKKHDFIKKYDKEFVKSYVANGDEINPEDVEPNLITVDDLNKSRIFNWIKLHWSIPVSSGYGRRLRYLVTDTTNGKIIGIIGLGDPVFALKDREEFIGWSRETKSRKLKHIMDAFVLGAIPPYNMILGGKLVASLISASEVYNDFLKKYGGTKSLIKEDVFDGKLAGITTSSALGKSSVYDRIKIPEGTKFHHVGWTSGSGDFHFLNGYYEDLSALVKQQGYTGKHKKWGAGVRSRRVVIRKALSLLGLPQKFLYHGIQRELFFAPHGKNWKEFLCDKVENLEPYNLSTLSISDFIKKRWIIPRAQRDNTYLSFKAEDYSLQLKLDKCLTNLS